MSYNTRRTGGRPQVNYHQPSSQGSQQQQQQQQQQRPAANRPVQQQNTGYNTSTTGSYNQPAFSTQGGYSSVQQTKQPQQAQQPQQQQQQQQQQQPQQPMPPQTPAMPQQPATLQAKVEPPSTPVPSNVSDSPVPMGDDKPESNGESTKRKPFWMKKGPGFKISKKVKRRRQNARLRKMLTPKNALMILNELHQGIKFTIQEQLNALNQTIYTVTVDVEGKQHHGQAMSKAAAKQLACENALKSLLLDKMGKAVQEQADSMDHTESGADESLKSENDGDDNMDGSSVSSVRSRKPAPEDDVPWGCLASFALHKLFLEWQSQGIQVPMVPPPRNPTVIARPLPTPDPVKLSAQGSPMPMKKIPDDASKRNPVQLLSQLKPASQYTEQRDGNPPNLTFTMSVMVDGMEFVGVAGNKRDAKRECARAALAKLGIVSDNN